MNETWRWCGHAHHFIAMSLGLEPGLFFETMVFPAHLVEDLGRDDNCHGYKVSSWSEVDRWHYRTAEAANEGHLRNCFTWGARQGVPS